MDTPEYLRRMERMAVDLSRHQHGTDAHEKADICLEQNRQMFHDPEIAAAYEIARRYEDNVGEKIRAYAGGWPQMVNWQTPGPGTAANTFTTMQLLTPTQQPNIAANTTQVGTMFKIAANGVYSTTGTPTLAIGVGIAAVPGAAGTWGVTAATTSQSTVTNECWQVWFNTIVTAVGSSGTIQGNGNVTNIGAGATTEMPPTQQTAPTWNTTTAQYFTIGAAWGTSSASNAITVNSLFVLQLN